MAEIIVSGIEKSFVQDRVVLDDVSFQVDAGERVGLLGPNGAGKTTLLKIITGEITPDKGFIAIPQGRRVGYISQLAEAPEGALVEDVLRMAFAEVQAVSAEIEQIQCQMDAGEHSEALLRRYDATAAKPVWPRWPTACISPPPSAASPSPRFPEANKPASAWR